MDTARLAQVRAYELWHWEAYTPEDTTEQLESTVRTAARCIAPSETFYMKCQQCRESLPSTPMTRAIRSHNQLRGQYPQMMTQDTVNDLSR